MNPVTIKIYKNISERRIPNINAVNQANDFVAEFIKMHKRILYGGMAIDLALKYIGHEGIYADDIMPDYDFYSPENITDSIKLTQFLYERGLNTASSINGLHLTTRRVRIDKFNFVADLSYYPQPYYNNIPIITTHGFNIVHPDFQRIDLHRSLSYLYSGIPRRENFRNRLKKDVKRFNILNEKYPIVDTISIDIKPINTTGIMMDVFGVETKIKIEKSSECIAGSLALHIMCLLTDVKSPFKTKSDYIISPDPPEIYIDDYDTLMKLVDEKTTYYDKTCDIFPETAVCFGKDRNIKIYYYNWSELIAAAQTKYGYVVNIHVLAFSYLFKYIMLGSKIYKTCYIKCLELMSKQHDLTQINGKYYGSANISAPAIFAERIDSCAMVDTAYHPRPEINWRYNQPLPQISVNKFITYKIAGMQSSGIDSFKPGCPTKTL